jgi:hypothetical protein
MGEGLLARVRSDVGDTGYMPIEDARSRAREIRRRGARNLIHVHASVEVRRPTVEGFNDLVRRSDVVAWLDAFQAELGANEMLEESAGVQQALEAFMAESVG